MGIMGNNGGIMGTATVFDQLLVFPLAYSADLSFVVPAKPKLARRSFALRHLSVGVKIQSINPIEACFRKGLI